MKYGIIEYFEYDSVKYGIYSDKGRFGIIDEAKKIGLQAVEIGIESNLENDSLWAGSSNERSCVKEYAVKNGIEICSVCLHLLKLEECSLISSDSKHRKAGMQLIKHAIELCIDIGASVILVPFFDSSEITTDEQKRILIDELTELSEEIKEHQVIIGIESTLKAEEILTIIEPVQSSNVGVYYDIGNLLRLGNDIIHEITLLENKIVQVHIKDDPYDKPIGKGCVNFTSVLKALAEVEFHGFAVMETPFFEDSVREAKANYSFLKSVEENL